MGCRSPERAWRVRAPSKFHLWGRGSRSVRYSGITAQKRSRTSLNSFPKYTISISHFKDKVPFFKTLSGDILLEDNSRHSRDPLPKWYTEHQPNLGSIKTTRKRANYFLQYDFLGHLFQKEESQASKQNLNLCLY